MFSLSLGLLGQIIATKPPTVFSGPPSSGDQPPVLISLPSKVVKKAPPWRVSARQSTDTHARQHVIVKEGFP